MTINELITALQRLEAESKIIVCLGCGHEHNCGIHGCAIIREAVEKLDDFNAVFNEETVMKLAGQCLKVDPARLRELAEADRDGRLVVLPCKMGDTVYMISWRLNGRHEIEERVFGLTYFDPAKYGKDYFLTREEAEKALEEMKDGNG